MSLVTIIISRYGIQFCNHTSFGEVWIRFGNSGGYTAWKKIITGNGIVVEP